MKLLVASGIVCFCSAGFCQSETATYVFNHEGTEPFRVSGGLLGPLGTYDIVGSMTVSIDHQSGRATIDSFDDILVGTAGRNFDLNGSHFNANVYHEAESLTGVFQDPLDITFLRRTDSDGNDVTCPIVEDQFDCPAPEINVPFMFTMLRLTSDGTTANLSAFSDAFGYLDASSAVLEKASAFRWLPGDFNFNGSLDISDIDTFGSAMRLHNANPLFDVDRSGELDRADLTHLVRDVLHSEIGDSNFDGRFTTSDLVRAFQFAQYEDGIPMNSTWESGDWNQDQEFNSSDLVFAFQGHCWEANEPCFRSHAVPEPQNTVIAVSAVLMIGCPLRRRPLRKQ